MLTAPPLVSAMSLPNELAAFTRVTSPVLPVLIVHIPVTVRPALFVMAAALPPPRFSVAVERVWLF
jgi:hypothetical protein